MLLIRHIHEIKHNLFSEIARVEEILAIINYLIYQHEDVSYVSVGICELWLLPSIRVVNLLRKGVQDKDEEVGVRCHADHESLKTFVNLFYKFYLYLI